MADLPQKTIESILLELGAGVSPEIISIKLGVEIDDVEELAEQFEADRQAKKSNADLLRDNLSTLQALLPTAEWVYKAIPDVDNMQALTTLISTSIQTIKEIEARKDPAIIMNELLGRVIQPMFRNFVKYATIEVNRSREDLFSVITPEHHSVVDTVLKEAIKGMGKLLGADYRQAVDSIAGILECKPEDEKVKPLLRVVPDDQEQAKEGTEDR